MIEQISPSGEISKSHIIKVTLTPGRIRTDHTHTLEMSQNGPWRKIDPSDEWA